MKYNGQVRMNVIKSTAEILAFKALNRNIYKKHFDWAVDMLMAGFDTDNLRILAGESEPLNQFYAQELVDKIFCELNLDYSNKDEIIKDYALFLIEKSLNGEIDDFRVLNILKDICVELDYADYLYDFYLLFYAKEDFSYSEYQCYWNKNNLTKENIDEFINIYFRNYLNGIETPTDVELPIMIHIPLWKKWLKNLFKNNKND